MVKKKHPYKRGQWLRDTIYENNYKIGAEVGVLKGMASRFMMEVKGFFLICVDLWEYRPEILCERERKIQENRNQHEIINIFKRNMAPYKGRYKVLRGVSWEMANKVLDRSLDIVFIDADHGYESVKKDILAWMPKVRKGGLLCGHDIDISGVNKAVNELIPDYQEAGIDVIWYKEM